MCVVVGWRGCIGRECDHSHTTSATHTPTQNTHTYSLSSKQPTTPSDLHHVQAAFYGMHAGQLMASKLQHVTADLLTLPAATPARLRQLCLHCWAPDPRARPAIEAVVVELNHCAVECLGEGRALGLFPDAARSLATAAVK